MKRENDLLREWKGCEANGKVCSHLLSSESLSDIRYVQTFGVLRNGHYDFVKRSGQVEADAELAEKIKECRDGTDKIYATDDSILRDNTINVK